MYERMDVESMNGWSMHGWIVNEQMHGDCSTSVLPPTAFCDVKLGVVRTQARDMFAIILLLCLSFPGCRAKEDTHLDGEPTHVASRLRTIDSPQNAVTQTPSTTWESRTNSA